MSETTAPLTDAPLLLAGTLLSVPLPKLLETPRQPLLLLLHGAGANERDLVPFARLLPPGVALAFLRGPIAYETGWSWTRPLTEDASTGAAVGRSADASASAIEAWLIRSGLDAGERPIGLLGFSGGGATALQVLRRRPERYAATVLLSSFVTGDAQEIGPQTRPKVFFGADPEDQVIGSSGIADTEAWLRQRTDLTVRSYAGTGHQVHEAAIREASAFLGPLLPL